MLPEHERLYLHEEIALLALQDEKGTFFMTKTYTPAIAGAIVAELLFHKRIHVEEGKKALVDLVDPSLTGDEVLDEALAKIEGAKRRASIKNWVYRICRLPKLAQKVAMGLCRRGVLREDEDQVLLFFRRKIFPTVDRRPEQLVVDRLRNAIFSDSVSLDPRTTILVSLAKSADLLSVPFEKWQIGDRKERIINIVKGEMIGRSTDEAAQAIQASVFVTAIMPAVTTVTRSGK